MKPVYVSAEHCATDRPETGLEGILGRSRSLVDGAQSLADRLAELEGRLFGGVAGVKTDATARPQPSGYIGQMNTTLDDLGERFDRMHAIIGRLNTAI